MSRCEGTFAGHFVITLQLLSWCAVGVLLLHRGLISVRRVDQVNQLNTTSITNNDSYSHSEQIRIDMLVNKSTEDVELTTKSDVIDKPTVENVTRSGNVSSEKKVLPVSQKTPGHVHNVRVATSKPRYDLTPSGVVMAALGVVMLVVGPSVVILRWCDSGPEGRNFDKVALVPIGLTADERALNLAALDQPPCYDDVAGQTPRYSMLFPDEDSSVVYTAVETHVVV